jgi:hypothetical protein
MKLSTYLDSVPPPSVGPRDTIVPGPGEAVLLGARCPASSHGWETDLRAVTHQVQVRAGSNYQEQLPCDV